MQQACVLITSRNEERAARSARANRSRLESSVRSKRHAAHRLVAVVVRAWAPTLTAGGPERSGRGPGGPVQPSRARPMPAAADHQGRAPAMRRPVGPVGTGVQG